MNALPAYTAPLRCLAIAGPTASGKTAAALAVAARWPVEIVSVDSALVYQGMDIGTAKPSAAERSHVPHHLIDIRDPLHAYSAAEFCADARRLIGEINARGRTALLVGGTMLYLKALAQGLNDLPRADAAVRAHISERAQALGWPALHAELARLDPITAQRLSPNDSQRIQRALEVAELSGQPMSTLYGGARVISPWSAGTFLSLEPVERSWLHERIAQRFDAMLAAGLLDEVRRLRARGDLHADLPSMRCVGYRQAWAWLDEQEHAQTQTTAVKRQTTPLRELGIFATRQLAKRQITWLRSMPSRNPVACDAPDALNQLLSAAQRVLGTTTEMTP